VVAPTNQPAASETGKETVATTGRSYDDFKLILDRNIFDPNRRARRPDRTEPDRPPEPKVDIVALTGTLIYQKGTFAFFDSNSSEYRKTAKAGDEIAGFLLKDVDQSHVALEREGRQLELKVGQQLRRLDEGAWEITSGERLAGTGGSSRSSSRRPGSSSGSAASNNRSLGSERSSSDPVDGDAENPESDESEAPAAEEADEGPSDVLKRLLEQRRKEQEQ